MTNKPPKPPEKPSDKRNEEPKAKPTGEISTTQRWLNAVRYGLWDI